MFTKFILAICLFLFGPLAAAIEFDHPLSIAELVGIGLENNPSTRQAWWNACRASAAVGNAKSAYYPKVGLDADVSHGRDFKYINGPDTTYTILGADLILSMLLYDFGERSANVNAARMSLLAANWQWDWSIQKVLVCILENAYSTLHSQEVLQSSHLSFEDAKKLWHAAQELNRAGLTPISDVYTAQATLAQMKMDVTFQSALLDIQKGKLAVSLGVSADTLIEVAALDKILEPQRQQTADLIALANCQRGDLMAKQALMDEAAALYDKSRAKYRPKLSVAGRGGANHAIHDKANAAQYQVALNLEIPLFTGFEQTYQNRMAYANMKLSREELSDLQLNISMEVLTYSRSLQAAQEMLPDADENLKSSIKAYESVLDKYKAGKERMAEVSNAQRQLAAARVRYSDVKTRWLISIANLAYATGTLNSDMPQISTMEKRCEN